MCNIADLIHHSQEGHPASTVKLIEKFMPLLKKYAFRLHYEDAFEDLQLDFLASIQSIDLSKLRRQEDDVLVKYIQNAIYHAYTKRLKSYLYTQKRVIPFCSMSDTQKQSIEYANASCDFYFELTFDDFKNILTPKEFMVVIKYFLYGQSIISIAAFCNISRQAANQAKLSAFNKLKQRWA